MGKHKEERKEGRISPHTWTTEPDKHYKLLAWKEVMILRLLIIIVIVHEYASRINALLHSSRIGFLSFSSFLLSSRDREMAEEWHSSFVSTQLTKFFYEKLFDSDLKLVVVAHHWILHKLKKLMMMMLLSLWEVSSICERWKKSCTSRVLRKKA
jgi:hypothetical protein